MMFFPSCSVSRSESPQFSPNQVLTIEGSYLKADGSPLAEKEISLKNYRYHGYVDYTKVTDTVLGAIILYPTIAFFNAWYFFFPYVGRAIEEAKNFCTWIRRWF